MFIGIPLNYRNTQCIADMVSSFGQFHYWNSTDRRKVGPLIRSSFPDNALLPRSVAFREFANWGRSHGTAGTTIRLLCLLCLVFGG